MPSRRAELRVRPHVGQEVGAMDSRQRAPEVTHQQIDVVPPILVDKPASRLSGRITKPRDERLAEVEIPRDHLGAGAHHGNAAGRRFPERLVFQFDPVGGSSHGSMFTNLDRAVTVPWGGLGTNRFGRRADLRDA